MCENYFSHLSNVLFSVNHQHVISFLSLSTGGSLVRREVAHNLMRLIAEGTDDEDTDAELRLDAVSAYVELLDKPNIPDILVKIICWVRHLGFK